MYTPINGLVFKTAATTLLNSRFSSTGIFPAPRFVNQVEFPFGAELGHHGVGFEAVGFFEQHHADDDRSRLFGLQEGNAKQKKKTGDVFNGSAKIIKSTVGSRQSIICMLKYIEAAKIKILVDC